MKRHIIEISKAVIGEQERCINDTQWKKLLTECNEDTIVSITSFIDLADCYKTLESRILDCYENNVQLAVDGELIGSKVVLKLIEFFRNTLKEQRKKSQAAGIQRALDRKRNGKGNYGRPKINLPVDFEEAIKCITNKEYSASEYMKRTGMKKSTFYKYCSDIKKGKKVIRDGLQYGENKD